MKAMKVIKAMTVMKVCERCFFRYTHFADACAADVSQHVPASAAAEGANAAFFGYTHFADACAAGVSQHVPASAAAEGMNAAFFGYTHFADACAAADVSQHVPALAAAEGANAAFIGIPILLMHVLQASRNTFLRLLRLKV